MYYAHLVAHQLERYFDEGELVRSIDHFSAMLQQGDDYVITHNGHETARFRGNGIVHYTLPTKYRGGWLSRHGEDNGIWGVRQAQWDGKAEQHFQLLMCAVPTPTKFSNWERRRFRAVAINRLVVRTKGKYIIHGTRIIVPADQMPLQKTLTKESQAELKDTIARVVARLEHLEAVEKIKGKKFERWDGPVYRPMFQRALPALLSPDLAAADIQNTVSRSFPNIARAVKRNRYLVAEHLGLKTETLEEPVERVHEWHPLV